MSNHNRISSTTKSRNEDEELLDPMQNAPSNFDLALNGGTNRSFLSPSTGKRPDVSLLEDTFRRLSVSTISSIGRERSISPHPNHGNTPSPRTWKGTVQSFYHQNRGLFLVTFSQLFGALMNVTTRLLELEGEGMHPFQILFVRQGLTAILCSSWMWWSRVPHFPLGKKEVRWLLVTRSVSGFFGIYGMYYSLQYLPVADAVVITFLAPSVASYGCYLFLKEPFPRTAQYASLISLLGVFMIARPTSFFPSSSSQHTITPPQPTNTTSPATSTPNTSAFPIPTSSQRLSAILIALIGVLGSAGAFTSIRFIGTRAHALISVNYFSFYCVIISTFFLTFSIPLHLSSTLKFALPASARQWGMLIFLGVCGFVMQFLLTMGLADTDDGGNSSSSAGGRDNQGGVIGRNGGGKKAGKGGSRATNMIYTNMLFALGLDRLVFGTVPTWWSLGGSGLILGSAIWVAVGKRDDEGVRVRDMVREVGVEDEEMAMLAVDGDDDLEGEVRVVSSGVDEGGDLDEADE